MEHLCGLFVDVNQRMLWVVGGGSSEQRLGWTTGKPLLYVSVRLTSAGFSTRAVIGPVSKIKNVS